MAKFSIGSVEAIVRNLTVGGGDGLPKGLEFLGSQLGPMLRRSLAKTPYASHSWLITLILLELELFILFTHLIK